MKVELLQLSGSTDVVFKENKLTCIGLNINLNIKPLNLSSKNKNKNIVNKFEIFGDNKDLWSLPIILSEIKYIIDFFVVFSEIQIGSFSNLIIDRENITTDSLSISIGKKSSCTINEATIKILILILDKNCVFKGVNLVVDNLIIYSKSNNNNLSLKRKRGISFISGIKVEKQLSIVDDGNLNAIIEHGDLASFVIKELNLTFDSKIILEGDNKTTTIKKCDNVDDIMNKLTGPKKAELKMKEHQAEAKRKALLILDALEAEEKIDEITDFVLETKEPKKIISKAPEMCLVCLSENISTTFNPCTHRVACYDCSVHFMTEKGSKAKFNCPTCRAPIKDILFDKELE